MVVVFVGPAFSLCYAAIGLEIGFRAQGLDPWHEHQQVTCLLCLRPLCVCSPRYPREQKRLDILNRLDLLAPAAAADPAASGDAAASQQPSTLTTSRSPMLGREATPLHEVGCHGCCCDGPRAHSASGSVGSTTSKHCGVLCQQTHPAEA